MSTSSDSDKRVDKRPEEWSVEDRYIFIAKHYNFLAHVVALCTWSLPLTATLVAKKQKQKKKTGRVTINLYSALNEFPDMPGLLSDTNLKELKHLEITLLAC